MSVLKTIGYSDWFKSRVDDDKIVAHDVARIVSVHKDSYTLTKGGAEIFAELSGNLLYSTESASDLPTGCMLIFTIMILTQLYMVFSQEKHF